MNAALPAVDAFYEQAACGLLATDAAGMIVRANATIHAWLGAQADALTGKLRFCDLLSVGARLFHHTRCVPLLELEGAVNEVQVDLHTLDGRQLPILLNIVRQPGADGGWLDHWAVFRSTGRHAYEHALLGARKVAEEALEAQRATDLQLQALNLQLTAADRRKDEFLATLSHELRNPLAPMRSAVDVFKLKYGSTTDERLLQAFDRQLRHLTRLVDDLMDVSRITQNRMRLRRTPIDLAPLVRGAAQDMAPAMAAARHTLRLSVPDAALVVDGDATRLAQVVINLLANAAKYTPDGGMIDVELACADGHAELRVRDNGIGIPADALGAVFNMFAQLEPALDRARGGLGIGLALARGIVDLHGGAILVESAGSGLGSEFTLRLPLVAGCAAPEATAASSALISPRRVLVVDDNFDTAETMALALELFGCETRMAHTAAAALEVAAEFAPDVALLDIGLPDYNGYELARRLRALPRGLDTTLIAATGWGQDKDRTLALDAGFDHHLTKPIDFEQLRLLLR
ncbi:hybrid sensor histidine kinase/response regulator [Massilia sp. CFBP9026]|uniref:hybrid sensor histidine kinase/response regulator n=1 Tax=Massilia sp. CFBP9026 TaxID=3096536 RepID=UPI002A6B5C91|nr:ATP-binding protein [Massilia sp. CFBP9026]MDY0962947.1 ATP-binding protein [Massilia sp. CFBP9026]